MNVTDYCDTMGQQLTAWKARIYDVIRRMETVPESDKASLAASLTVLNSLADELETGLGELSDQCPGEWSSQRESLDEKLDRMRGILAQLSEKVGLPDSLAWL